ncbi:class II aldolase/adducin domain-containing protein [Histoplasma capsulatum G186AR]|uniref:Class II aldolase/adducin domain-containing protein n=1 Tax=Ajellomyces capsulatus (strain G186AR / H82 / ATCC MYA-2454 / RMSCC 2432) TaxID=447093 RepID=C0NL00_AJECG|nr:class II aldolase/adducin domain-containing protein [Histoplasma capsulatum G186AR]EEH08541.1 class II aldolase/adducin domain-containing protein [Histoplasma capsulatum G186AR]
MAPSIVKEEPIALMSKKDRSQQGKKSAGVIEQSPDTKPHRDRPEQLAFRVFADRDFDEGVAGHISEKNPIFGGSFLMETGLNPLSQHFSQISVSDLILINENGDVVIGTEPVNSTAFAIHSEIHKARPNRALGDGKAVILQNHGLLTVEESSVDEAAFWFINLDKTCHAQLLADAASAGTGHKKIMIDEEEAEGKEKAFKQHMARVWRGAIVWHIGITEDGRIWIDGSEFRRREIVPKTLDILLWVINPVKQKESNKSTEESKI